MRYRVGRVVKLGIIQVKVLRVRTHGRQPFDCINVRCSQPYAITLSDVTSNQGILPYGITAQHSEPSPALATGLATAVIQSLAMAFIWYIFRRGLERRVKAEVILCGEPVRRFAKLLFDSVVGQAQAICRIAAKNEIHDVFSIGVTRNA